MLIYSQNGMWILVTQIFLIFFTCDASPSASIFFKHFPVFKRFTYTSVIYALSRALTYVATSFGFVYCMRHFNNCGLYIITLPVCVAYWYGLNYFRKLEIDSGNYQKRS